MIQEIFFTLMFPIAGGLAIWLSLFAIIEGLAYFFSRETAE